MTMLDIGCGLGGASRAMRERGWRVIRVDWMADIAPDVVADMRALPFRKIAVDLLWVSTSCSQFTNWRLPWKTCVAARRPIDLSCELSAKEFIAQLGPRFWVVENVYSSREHLTPIFGPVRVQSGSHALWGNLPGLMPQVWNHDKSTYRSRFKGRKRHLLRSVIPYDLSLALAIATERRVNDNG
jgi:hypothetical protein